MARAASVVLTCVLAGCGVLLAGPAAASTPEPWPDNDPPSALVLVGIFGGIPLAIAAVLVLLILLPRIVKGPQAGSGQHPWTDPQWFGGAAEVESGPSDSGAAAGHRPSGPSGSTAASPSEKAGGAGARW